MATVKRTKARATKRTAKRTTAKKSPARQAVARVAKPRGPQVGWWEISLRDKPTSDRVKRFFTTVFGWKVESDPVHDYGQVSEKDAGIGGGIGPSQMGTNSLTFYIGVPDIGKYLKKIEAAGGKTVMPETSMGSVSFAQFTDPAGNLIGLFKGSGEAD